MMGYLVCFFTFLVSFLLQSTILKNIAIFGITPDLILILVVTLSLLFHEKYGIIYGVLFGFIQDIYFFQITGMSAMIYFIIGFLIHEMRKLLFRENMFAVALLGMGGVMFYHFMFWGLNVLFGVNYDFLYMLQKMPGRMIYNIVIILIVYRFIVVKIIKDKGDRYIW